MGAEILPKPKPDVKHAQLLLYVKDFTTLLNGREKAYRKLYVAHVETLKRLARAAEHKDDDTGVHLLRMSTFSEMLARAYGLPESYCELIQLASPLHDIGKIGIPDNIKKNGRLNTVEWQIMKKHPEFGAEILGQSDVPVIKLAAEIALSHHEKFDGSGYPSGLKGEQIPLNGRIVALADFYDALTMERCYKKALPDDDVFKLIESERNKHFDPELVTTFISIRSELIEMRKHINSTQQY